MVRTERIAAARHDHADQSALAHRLVPDASFSTQAPFRSHLWSFMQSGQRSGIITPDSDSNLIFSVVRPVGTGFPVVGQRIIILGMIYSMTKRT
jgi:hypothetical protein